MTHFKVHTVCNAGQPFRDDGDNVYRECFDEFYGDYGIYVFQDKRTGDVLYVGESHYRNQERDGLGVRISQHYTHTNTGGNFRINWCRVNCNLPCSDGDQCSSRCNPSFKEFKRLVRNSRLIVFSFSPSNNDREEDTRKIIAFEKFLILMFEPIWNTG